MLVWISNPLKTALSRFCKKSTATSLTRSFVRTSKASPRRYDTNEDNAILKGRAKGSSWLEIAEQLDRSWRAIRARHTRLSTTNSPTSARLRWKSTDRESLLQDIKDGKTISEVAARLGRTESAIRLKYHKLIPKSRRLEYESRRFSRAQDAVILQLRDVQRRSARYIGRQLGMTASSISKRYEMLSESAPITSGPFTASEDKRIIQLRVQYGFNFGEIARRLGRRTNPVRMRYYGYLHSGSKPSLSRVGTMLYTEAEDAQIVRLRDAGSGWEAISAQMPHRTPRSIQDRYRRLRDRENWPKDGDQGELRD